MHERYGSAETIPQPEQLTNLMDAIIGLSDEQGRLSEGLSGREFFTPKKVDYDSIVVEGERVNICRAMCGWADVVVAEGEDDVWSLRLVDTYYTTHADKQEDGVRNVYSLNWTENKVLSAERTTMIIPTEESTELGDVLDTLAELEAGGEGAPVMQYAELQMRKMTKQDLEELDKEVVEYIVMSRETFRN